MELLKEIFNLNTTKKFISICENVATQNPLVINNGLGINFSKSEIESVKLYYGFHHKLSKIDVEKLHLFSSPDTFIKAEKLLSNSDYDFHPYYPTGVSFALKIDKNLNISMGHFMMPQLKKNDMFFSLPKVIELNKSNTKLPVLDRKGIFTMINQNGMEHQKDYFYVNNSRLKRMIGNEFGVNTDIVPSIEWVLGKGFYSGSSPNDEKIVLQSNYNEVYKSIIKNENNETIKGFNKLMLDKFNAYCVCPGYYKNKDIKSYYYFNGKLLSPTIIDTISGIQSNLHLI